MSTKTDQGQLIVNKTQQNSAIPFSRFLSDVAILYYRRQFDSRLGTYCSSSKAIRVTQMTVSELADKSTEQREASGVRT